MAAASSLAFLTPVFERYALTEICLRQRRWVCDELKQRFGLDATCIVIGNDANLDLARDLGFLTREHSNLAERFDINGGQPYVALGMKFNAGYEVAHQQGIDLVFPIGSDSWIDPVYFSELPDPGELLLSRAYNLVTPDAGRRGALWIGWEGGVQWITWTEDWAHRNYRPISDALSKGCDTSTWTHRSKTIRVGEHSHHQLEYVAFQSPSNQITDYARIMERYGVGETIGPAVFGDLAEHYQHVDIIAMRKHYNSARVVKVAELLANMNREMEETQEHYLELLDEAATLTAEEAA